MVSTSAIVALLQKQIPGFSVDKAGVFFNQLGVDSFGMLELRATIEQATGAPMPDTVWVEIDTPAQLVARLASGVAAEIQNASSASLDRSYQLNMPQMALGGLSESWLCKELGDVHWKHPRPQRRGWAHPVRNRVRDQSVP